jgi:hypothetical protein
VANFAFLASVAVTVSTMVSRRWQSLEKVKIVENALDVALTEKKRGEQSQLRRKSVEETAFAFIFAKPRRNADERKTAMILTLNAAWAFTACQPRMQAA